MIQGTAPGGYTIWARLVDSPQRGPFRTTSDPSGHFRIQGLGPGRYRVTAIATSDRAPQEGGEDIVLVEGETRNIELKP